MNGEDQLCCCHFASCSLHNSIILGFPSSEDFMSHACCRLFVGFDEEFPGVVTPCDIILSRLPVKEHPHKLIPSGVGRYIFENDVDGGVAHTPIILGFLESWEQKEAPRLGAIVNPCKQMHTNYQSRCKNNYTLFVRKAKKNIP